MVAFTDKALKQLTLIQGIFEGLKTSVKLYSYLTLLMRVNADPQADSTPRPGEFLDITVGWRALGNAC